MQINGLTNVDEEIRPIVLSFIGNQYDESDIININIDNDLININDSSYYICTASDAREIQRNANDEYFEDQLYECPRDWRNYIDKDAWIDDNGMSETEAIARIFDKDDCYLVDRINNYNIYNV
jgi:hypothetical protein